MEQTRSNGDMASRVQFMLNAWYVRVINLLFVFDLFTYFYFYVWVFIIYLSLLCVFIYLFFHLLLIIYFQIYY